ncbi:MAG: tail protein X [Pseudomonadota bacterium]
MSADIIGTYTVPQDGQRLDQIAADIYPPSGDRSPPGGVVDALLLANPGIAEAWHVPAGTVLNLPAAEAPEPVSFTRPWE